MVGYDERHERQLTSTQYAIAGAISGIITRLCLQPLDVLKIRFQIQIEPSLKINNKPSFKYQGIRQALKVIRKEEGIQALWKGHIPGQFLSLMYGSVQFTTFEVMTKALWTFIPHEKYKAHKPAIHFVCGGISGLCSTVVVQPADVLRTRLVAQGEPKIYNGLYHAVISMYRENGLRTFYKGLLPTMIEIFPHSGLYFGFYTLFQTIWCDYTNAVESEVSAPRTLFCGTTSGICTRIVIHPLDVVKKRLQIEGFDFKGTQTHKSLPSGMVNCIRNIVKHEGIFGFYKGLKVNVVKGGCVVGLSFLAYEECCKSIRLLSR